MKRKSSLVCLGASLLLSLNFTSQFQILYRFDYGRNIFPFHQNKNGRKIMKSTSILCKTLSEKKYRSLIQIVYSTTEFPGESLEVLSLSSEEMPPVKLVDKIHEWWKSKPVDTSMVPLTGNLNGKGIALSFDIAPEEELCIEVNNYGDHGCELSVKRKSQGTYSLGTQIEGLIKDMESQIVESLRANLDQYLSNVALKGSEGNVKIEGDIIDVTDAMPTPQQQQSDQKDPADDLMKDQTIEQKQKFDSEVEKMFQNYYDAQEEMGFKGVIKEERAEREKDSSKQELDEIFRLGASLATRKSTSSKIKQKEELSDKEDYQITTEPLGRKIEEDLAEFSVMLGDGIQGGIDIFQGPIRISSSTEASVDDSSTKAVEVQTVEEEHLSDVQKEELQNHRMKLAVLVKECGSAPDDLFSQIASEYKDVLLTPFYVAIMRDQLVRAETERDREVLGKINQYAMTLIKEMGMLMEIMEKQQLEKIRDICETAMEDMSKLSAKVKNMKFLLDKDFIAYLKYATEEERKKIRTTGMDPDREPSEWLQVLLIIKKGVYAELQRDIREQIDLVSYIIRMNTAEQRKMLLEKFVDTMASMDVRKFKKVVQNIVDNFSLKKNEDEQLAERIAELGENIELVLPESRVKAIMRPVEQAAQQLMHQSPFLSSSDEAGANKFGQLKGLRNQPQMPGQPPAGQYSMYDQMLGEEISGDTDEDVPMFREGIMDIDSSFPGNPVDVSEFPEEEDF